MAQSGYTPIKLYYSATTTNVPLAANLAPGELAINTADGKLFYADSSNVVQVIGWKTTPASAGGTGVSNSYTITLGGAVSTAGSFTTSGAYSLTLTSTSSTNVTLPTTGTLATLAGVETFSNKTVTGTKETVYAITDGAAFEINPANGGIQTITLGASRTPKGTSFTAGQSVSLVVTAGAYTLTWTDTTFGASGVKWIGASAPGTAPTLSTTATTFIELWKVGTQVYGALVGIA
jgi:hypothetical protein